jgi:hypothetical protein
MWAGEQSLALVYLGFTFAILHSILRHFEGHDLNFVLVRIHLAAGHEQQLFISSPFTLLYD